MVALSLPLPAEVIAWAFATFLLTFFFEVPGGATFLVRSEVRTQRALVTPEARALTEPAIP